jgi:hypothetical protein
VEQLEGKTGFPGQDTRAGPVDADDMRGGLVLLSRSVTFVATVNTSRARP